LCNLLGTLVGFLVVGLFTVFFIAGGILDLPEREPRRCPVNEARGRCSPMPLDTPADDEGHGVSSDAAPLAHALDLLEQGSHPPRTPQVVGNLILTSHAGLIILLGLVLLYFTGLEFAPLRTMHFALGFALVPILLVKLGSTGWRAVNYYFDRGSYRAAGPPWLLPRLIALPLATCAVVATISGVVLWATGTDRGTWAAIHTDSVIALGVVALVHLAVYMRKAVRASASGLEGSQVTQQERIICVGSGGCPIGGRSGRRTRTYVESVLHHTPNSRAPAMTTRCPLRCNRLGLRGRRL
jgi:hypothetical protein